MGGKPQPWSSSQVRQMVDGARAQMGAELAGGATGSAVCRDLSDLYDRIVVGMWQGAVRTIDSSVAARMAVVATGGWGRREVCPYSDIDFTLLVDRRDVDAAHGLADALLYPLWDAGLRVGHSVRDVREAVGLAQQDLATATAYLDARHIAGSSGAVAELVRRSRSIIAPGGNANRFVDMLRAEKDRRHRKFGASLYLLEPNLKLGIGALRDLATGVWAAKARWDVMTLDELMSRGALSRRLCEMHASGRDFLLGLRSLVQLGGNRGSDQLTFELQEQIAPRLIDEPGPVAGEVRPAVAPAVEALMRRYYLHARSVVQVTDRLLDSATVPPRRKPRVHRLDGSFLLWNGQLAVTGPDVFRDRPSEMFRIFRVAVEREIPIYWHTKELMAERVASGEVRFDGDPVAAREFLATLIDLRDRSQPSVLEEMHQLGLVSALFPEFEPCTCRVQHDLYHVYTVDQHLLYSVAMLKKTLRGEVDGPHRDAVQDAVATISNPRPLFLATLLHDVGKPLGKGHSQNGSVVGMAIAERLGLSAEEAERTGFLIREHLTMSHLSQRRDLSDRDIIHGFVESFEDAEQLAQLYLLTRCDTAMTAPGNLNAWKDQLMAELYTRAKAQLGGTREDLGQLVLPTGAEVRARALEILARASQSGAVDVTVVELLAAVDDSFVEGLSPRQLARHISLAERFLDSDESCALEVTGFPLKGHSEVAIVARDSPGLLAELTGLLASRRIDIDAAVVTTAGSVAGQTPLALDLFFVRDPGGKMIADDDHRWQKLGAELAHLMPETDRGQRIAEMVRRRRHSTLARFTPGVATDIRVLNGASANFTVIEVVAQDRPGVLHTICRALSDSGLDIRLAKVATEGEKVADAFYVCDRSTGEKLTDEQRIAQLTRSLEEALGPGARAE